MVAMMVIQLALLLVVSIGVNRVLAQWMILVMRLEVTLRQVMLISLHLVVYSMLLLLLFFRRN